MDLASCACDVRIPSGSTSSQIANIYLIIPEASGYSIKPSIDYCFFLPLNLNDVKKEPPLFSRSGPLYR
jgi:hypothetical protein